MKFFTKIAVIITFFTIRLSVLCYASDVNIDIIGAESQMASSDFYLVEQNSVPWAVTNLHSVFIDGKMYIFVDNSMSDTVPCDIYTGWDEYVTTVTLDTHEDNYINNVPVIPVNVTIPIIELICDSDEFNAMNSDPEKQYRCDINVYSNYYGFKGQSAELKGHGNSTWHMATKKPYNIYFDHKTNIKGIGKSKDYVFLANTFDTSLQKNSICFNLAKEMGLKYTPNSNLCHMFVNGYYKGIYQLTNKMKNKNGIMSLDNGDYLICLGALDPKQKVDFDSSFYAVDSEFSDNGPYFDLVYPKDASSKDLIFIHDQVQQMFSAIENNDFESLNNVMDVESFAKLYWIEEISMNYDAQSRSIYMYYSGKDNKFHAGPLWDMDLTFYTDSEKDNIDYSTPTGWKANQTDLWGALYNNNDFRNEIISVYNEYDIPLLLTNSLNELNNTSKSLEKEGYINNLLYDNETTEHRVWLDSTYLEYCNNLADFYSQRIRWIESEMEAYYNPSNTTDINLILILLGVYSVIIIAMMLVHKRKSHK